MRSTDSRHGDEFRSEMRMKVQEIFERSAQHRRELMDNLMSLTNGKPTANQILLVDFTSTMEQEVATICARFSQLCDELTAGDSAAGVQDAPLDLEGGKKLLAIGGVLRCSFCNAEQSLAETTPEQAANYMALGFPRCCGFQMLWTTDVELGREKTQ
jgi:hypothetical protein